MSLHRERILREKEKTIRESKRRHGRTIRTILICVILFYLAAAFTSIVDDVEDVEDYTIELVSNPDYDGSTSGRDLWYLTLVNLENPVSDSYEIKTQNVMGIAIHESVAPPLEEMLLKAEEDGVQLKIYKGFDNGAETDEHITGLSVDFSDGSIAAQEFDKTEQYEWLLENAGLFGFVERFPKGKEEFTGMEYQPWHFRYVGGETASFMNEKGYCLEEYLDFYYNHE